jgi:hypothetical protein
MSHGQVVAAYRMIPIRTVALRRIVDVDLLENVMNPVDTTKSGKTDLPKNNGAMKNMVGRGKVAGGLRIEGVAGGEGVMTMKVLDVVVHLMTKVDQRVAIAMKMMVLRGIVHHTKMKVESHMERKVTVAVEECMMVKVEAGVGVQATMAEVEPHMMKIVEKEVGHMMML